MIYLVPALSAAAWGLIEVMVFLNPSGTVAFVPQGVSCHLFFIASTALAFFLPFFTGRQKTSSCFLLLLFSSMVVLVFISAYAGRVYHRDFHTFGAQTVMLSLAMFLLKADEINLIKRKRVVYSLLTGMAIVIFVLWISWLMMMSYAIVTRSEPRWVESTGYNLINGLIGLLLLGAAACLWEHSRRRLRIKGNQLYIDNREISVLLSPQETNLIMAFLVADENQLNCEMMYKKLNEHEASEKEGKAPACTDCLNEKWTATSCHIYRNYKNRIKDTKKYLELLQIGTIVPVSENPRMIKESGWKLRLFDDVSLIRTFKKSRFQNPVGLESGFEAKFYNGR